MCSVQIRFSQRSRRRDLNADPRQVPDVRRRPAGAGATSRPPRSHAAAAGATSRCTITDALRRDRGVDRCPVCEGADFYGRKDFDPKIGLTVVIIGALDQRRLLLVRPRSHRLQHSRRRRAHRSDRLRTPEGSDRLLSLPHRVSRRPTREPRPPSISTPPTSWSRNTNGGSDGDGDRAIGIGIE